MIDANFSPELAFVKGLGKAKTVMLDFAGLEIRIASVIAGNKVFIDFETDGELYTSFTRAMFGVPVVTPGLRLMVKDEVYRQVYGAGGTL